MTRITRSLIIMPLLAGGILAACGDSDDSLTEEAFRESANEICTVGGDEIHEAFFSVFGEEEPTPEAMQAALDTVMSVSRRQLDDVEGLDEPESLRDDVTALLAQGRSDTDDAEAMGLEFFNNEDDPWTRTNELARELGLDACAGG